MSKVIEIITELKEQGVSVTLHDIDKLYQKEVQREREYIYKNLLACSKMEFYERYTHEGFIKHMEPHVRGFSHE